MVPNALCILLTVLCRCIVSYLRPILLLHCAISGRLPPATAASHLAPVLLKLAVRAIAVIALYLAQ